MEASAPILVVEDEARIASSLVAALETSGFVVSLCGTGFDALNYIEMEDEIVAIVTDVNLSEGPDGWEIARRARAHFPDAPVVYISGDAAAARPGEAVANSRLIRKPISPNDLVKVVSALLH